MAASGGSFSARDGTDERSELLARPVTSNGASRTRRLGLVAIFVVIWSWVVQAEAAQALQDASHFSKPFFIVCFNHTVTVVLLPVVYLFHRLHDAREHHHLSLLHQTKRSNGVIEVLQRHSELPLSKLLRMAAFLSVFYCFADYFWYAALANVSVAAGTAIFNCSPFFVYCFSICFLHERASYRKLAGVLLSFVGVTLIVLYQNGDVTEILAGADTSSLGFIASLLVVVSAAIYGAYEVAVRVIVGEDINDTSTLLTLTGLCGLLTIPIWMFGSVVFACSPFPSLYEPLGWPVSGDAMAMLVLSGSLAAVFNVAFPFALCWTSPLETSVGCMLTIPLSGLWDTVFHQTVFSWECVLGSVCVMAGFVVLELSGVWARASAKSKTTRYSMAETAVAWSPISAGDVVV